MPVVQSIDGVFAPYWDYSSQQRQRGSRNRKGLPKELGSEDAHRGGTDPAVLAAQHAYQQGTLSKARKPVVLAADVMTSPVITLPPETALTEAWGVMNSRGIHHVPIVSANGLMVGIVSDRDLAHLSFGSSGQIQALPQQIRALMSTQLLTATPSTPIQDIVSVMLHENVSALPILEEDHRLLGIVTTSDILRALVNHAPLELWT